MTKVFRLKAGEALSPADLAEAAEAAQACRIVAFPTDTVYGLGSNGLIKAAVRRIYEVKSRDSMKPLPILVHSAEAARRWVEWTPAAEALAKRFWPGPLTLVLKPTREGRLLTFTEFTTLAIRVPAHPVLLALLEASGVPWASSSANRSGSPALTDGNEVEREFNGKVDILINNGLTMGKESTVVEAHGAAARVLREGALLRDDIAGVLAAAP